MLGLGLGLQRGVLLGGIDPDAQAFITAAGITNPTQQKAIIDLVGGLKANNLFSKLLALYPFVGGNSTAHSLNLINTANFQLIFNGGWTHNANGAQPNGSNGWAQTGLIPNTNFSGAYYECSYHNNTTGTYNGALGGGLNAFSYIDSTDHRLFFSAAGSALLVTGAPNNGFHQMQRAAGLDTMQVNLLRVTRAGVLNLGVTNELAIGAINNGATRSDWNSKVYKLRAYGTTALTNTDLDNFNTLVQAYQTTLGRL